MRTRTLQAGRCPIERIGSAGFTLLELLVVFVVIALIIAGVSASLQRKSGAYSIKATAFVMASRFRDARVAAITRGIDSVATIDVARRRIRFYDRGPVLKIDPTISLKVTAADSERRSPSQAGVRFFPNGSSTGATIVLKREKQVYEVRINWLTGRVSTRSPY